MAKNTRKFPKEDDDKLRDTIKKLRSRLRRLTKEVADLKSENATLLDAWAKTEVYLSDITEGMTLEELLSQQTMPKKPKKKSVKKPKSKEPVPVDEDQKEAVREKWRKWRKDNL